MASFLEQLEHAEMLLQTYRCPELEDVLTLLDTVLQAAELGSIQYESVVRIQVQRQSVRIDTEWSARCCAQTSTYELPRSIVEAEDPVGAAQYWAREQKLAKAHDRVERAQAKLRAAQAAYDCAMEQNHL